ncbi:hypothetical protein S7711_04708 [Stachybotrys chartarum IBT 7711]|uniref:Glycosyl hydrolase family 32 N-terminal domain-containing protein n=1 Tax=Stachybotrys chartarum (strain CBS 109288 / IBT 7711) TaxID=1280523 RepID=A0A084ANZ7_STACB|nr:hypothetical protein S7711_04708 [Stachybotrys chartarum IBT 7711]
MDSSVPSTSFQRPAYHFTAPRGWMNDPCGPGYDPSTKTYHLFYQWNPKSCEWGNISWGHATSKDMVKWEHSSGQNPVLSPDDPFDKEGVFTGCMLPQGVSGEDGTLTLIYSSVCHLPIHWTIPYVRGCEGIAVATSADGGKSWKKIQGNPILQEEPANLEVTGFRDPYVAAWPGLDETLGAEGPPALYGVVSGGVRNQGPAVFLYKLQQNDLTKWNYIGLLLKFTPNYRPSPKWNGDFGINWECACFMSLTSTNTTSTRDFLIMGSEGGHERPWVKSYHDARPKTLLKRTTRYCLWLSGSLAKNEAPDGPGNEVTMTHDMGGIVDHGSFYAANTFFDPVQKRRVLWGWLPEEDLPMGYCTAKGWNGSLALPRELFVQRLEGVVGALHSALDDIGSIRAEKSSETGTFAVETLGIRPIPELTRLRPSRPIVLDCIVLPEVQKTKYLTPARDLSWEVEASVSIRDGCDAVGLFIKHNEDYKTHTRIEFLPASEEIVVVREASNSAPDINKCDERGPFTLFKTQNGGKEEIESLQLRIFCDNDLVEIYANDRFALSTTTYQDNPQALLISLFANGSIGSAIFQEVRIWSGMDHIFT